MNLIKIVALAFIVCGAAGLYYGTFRYTKETQEAKIGSLVLSVKEKEEVNIPVWVGVGGVVIGCGLLMWGTKVKD